MKKLGSNWIYLIIVAIFSFLGTKALFHPGLFTAHDIWHQVVRLYYYSQGVNDGQFPPYWVSTLANGFGYPLFSFSYHLPWIISIPLLKTGFDIPGTIKSLFFLSYISSGITMYFFVSTFLKNRLAATLSSILYLWLPYHFLIIFVGGSMGIAFVFTFLPLIFLGIHLNKEESKFGIPVLSLGVSGLILSHIMHLIFLLPIIIIFVIWEFVDNKKRVDFLKNLTFGLILGILLSSFYLIPAIYYNQFTRAQQESGFHELYKRNFINFNQLIYSKWGYGPIINNAKNGENSFQLGFAQWFSVICLTFLIIFRKLSKAFYGLSISLLLGFILSIFLMLDSSKFIWELLVKFATIDFPFRLVLPASFIASICAGIVFVNAPKKLRRLIFIFIVFVALYTNRNHINVNMYTDFPVSNYLDLETEITTNTFNEYLPIQANAKLINKPWNELVLPLESGDAKENVFVSNLKHTTNLLSFDLDSAKEATASIGQFYFPGQTLYLDKKITEFTIDKDGKISFLAPQGIHNVAVKYQETILIKASKLLTIGGILIILFLLLKEIKIFKKKFYS